MIRSILQLVIIYALFICSAVVPAFASEPHLLKATFADIKGQPLEGAKLFLYDSINVHRPADFISNLSDRSGQVQMILPPGKYWGVARFKVDGKYGPLLPGDKHSGDPLEIDMTESLVTAEFVVADIIELGQKKRSNATDSMRIKGRVFDVKGDPVANAYVFANGSKRISELPDFISAWTGADGMYEIYLPPVGLYFVAAARQFPLINEQSASRSTVVQYGKIDIAIDIDFTVD